MYLRGAHIGVSEEFGDGVEVGSVCEGKRRKCVTALMGMTLPL